MCDHSIPTMHTIAVKRDAVGVMVKVSVEGPLDAQEEAGGPGRSPDPRFTLCEGLIH
jgi:hypothetical protein